jgi:hypothetical protein
MGPIYNYNGRQKENRLLQSMLVQFGRIFAIHYIFAPFRYKLSKRSPHFELIEDRRYFLIYGIASFGILLVGIFYTFIIGIFGQITKLELVIAVLYFLVRANGNHGNIYSHSVNTTGAACHY